MSTTASDRRHLREGNGVNSQRYNDTLSTATIQTQAMKGRRLALAQRLYEGELPEKALLAYAEWTRLRC
jgi:hypothetical protein